MAKYYYIRKDHGMRPEDAHVIESDYDAKDWRYLARECAADFHSEHDGWESRWPIDFEIFTAERKSIGVFSVEREYMPYFSPSKKTDSQSAGGGV